MLRLNPTEDYALIRSIATHPKIWDRITDDTCGPVEDWQPIEHPALIYLLAEDDEGPLGYWLLRPHASYLWECHTVLLPRAWGSIARELAQMGIAWMWENTPARRIMTQVPAMNRLALRFALECGFTQWGLQPDAYLKNGKLHSILYLGISKTQDL